MDFAAQLRLLEEAHGDPAKLALAAVDFALSSASDSERNALKETLVAAAIPHWCNAEILAALLELSPAESARRFALLARLNEVEAFEARGEGAINIHESARLALRKHIAREEPKRFRSLSAKAAAYFAASNTRTGRIEWLYHLLCAAPDEGAAECETLTRSWELDSAPQDRDALALALHELETTGLVQGRARLEALLGFAENQIEHGEFARAAKYAPIALEVAKQIGHATGEANAYDLLGQTWEAQGDTENAFDAYTSALRLRRDLAAAKPSDTTARWGLAVACSRLGDIYQKKGALDQALEYLGESADILKKLNDDEPANRAWLREGIVAITRMGDLLRAKGALADARSIYEAARVITGQLVAEEPANEDYQEYLAMALFRIARMHDAEHKREAREALDEYFRICRNRLSHDPNDAQHLSNLTSGYQVLAKIEMAEDHLDAALEALAEERAILQQLLARDPNVLDWNIKLALNFTHLSSTFWRQQNFAEARVAAEDSLKIMRDLLIRDPANLQKQRDVAMSHYNVAALASAISKHKSDAIAHYEEASRLYAAVVAAAPERADWVAEQKQTDEDLAIARGSDDAEST